MEHAVKKNNIIALHVMTKHFAQVNVLWHGMQKSHKLYLNVYYIRVGGR